MLNHETNLYNWGPGEDEGISIFAELDNERLDLFVVNPNNYLDYNEKNLLENFFLASRTTSIRKEISAILKLNGENLYEY